MLRTGTLLCFGKFLVPKKFMEERGGFQNFPSKLLGLTVSKKFAVESFSVSLVSGTEIFLLRRVISRFSVDVFFSRSTEKLCGGTLLCSLPEKFRQQNCFG